MLSPFKHKKYFTFIYYRYCIPDTSNSLTQIQLCYQKPQINQCLTIQLTVIKQLSINQFKAFNKNHIMLLTIVYSAPFN